VLNVAVKIAVTPLLIGGASLAGRRFGHRIGGWLVALPLTSGPVTFFLATDHGPCAAWKVIAAGQAAYRYSLIAPPRMRVRRSLPGWPCWRSAAGSSLTSGGSWSRAW
jgi:hypothetical protein